MQYVAPGAPIADFAIDEKNKAMLYVHDGALKRATLSHAQ